MGAARLHLVTSDQATHAQSGVYPAAKHLAATDRPFPGVTRAMIAAKLREIQEREVKAGNSAVTTPALARRIGLSKTMVERMLDGRVRVDLAELLAFGSIGREVIAWAMGGGK